MRRHATRRLFHPALLTLVSVVLTLLSVACSDPLTPEKDITVTVGYDSFTQDSSYSGSVRLLAGGTLTIKLFSNGSTGYQWSNPAQLSDPTVLEQTGHQFIPPIVPDPGAGGQEEWTFRATGRGNCVVYTEYKRSSDTVPNWTFTLTVTVL